MILVALFYTVFETIFFLNFLTQLKFENSKSEKSEIIFITHISTYIKTKTITQKHTQLGSGNMVTGVETIQPTTKTTEKAH